MIVAESKIKPRLSLVPFWSPTLKRHGQALSYYNERVRVDSENGDLGLGVRRPACIPPDNSITTTEELVAKQFECKNAWREALANGEKLRRQHLLERAEKAQHDRNITLESALKQIINAETSKALNKRQGSVMKGS